MDYHQSRVPAHYQCGTCGRIGVKLWREYQTFGPRLFCSGCAARHEDINNVYLQHDGTRIDRMGNRTSTIGNLVPAVPDEEEQAYWGYSSIPEQGVAWWRKLPNT